MKPAANENPHVELECWLKIALEDRSWPNEASPHISGEALMIAEPDGHEGNGRMRWGWVAVTSREQLLKALGYGPIFD